MTTQGAIGMLVLLAGCPSTADTPDRNGQFGEEESIQCESTSRTPVGPGDTVEVGYSDELRSVLVSDMLAIPAGTFTETLAWSDGTETPVTALLANAGSPELVLYEDVGNVEEPVEGACPTLLEFAVDVTLTTGDGRMNDGFVGDAYTLGDTLWVDHRITTLGGSIDVEALAQDGVDVEPDVVRVHLGVTPDASFSGSLLPQPVGGFDDDAQSLGQWPAAPVEE